MTESKMQIFSPGNRHDRGCLFVIARSASDEAISEVGIALPRFARNDRGELPNNLVIHP